MTKEEFTDYLYSKSLQIEPGGSNQVLHNWGGAPPTSEGEDATPLTSLSTPLTPSYVQHSDSGVFAPVLIGAVSPATTPSAPPSPPLRHPRFSIFHICYRHRRCPHARRGAPPPLRVIPHHRPGQPSSQTSPTRPPRDGPPQNDASPPSPPLLPRSDDARRDGVAEREAVADGVAGGDEDEPKEKRRLVKEQRKKKKSGMTTTLTKC
ncbi:hypothetical protein HPB52_008182 [Rhipicephalus sanguineus]|uniref:Uncharacterized protein n=1 Tax=Rhipicephalus sanguineus TaxID=34632 RepID=A0A9D4SY06_RHISA|nr:hypothetical protein HPB52_008182 [Rhipicephalus sanguineus]